MSLEVPDGLTSKPQVEGNDRFFAFRASDGQPIIFSATQLFEALLKLKTINGNTITGTGNITVASSETRDTLLEKLEVLPEESLPEINLLQFFNTAKFAVVNGVIDYIGSGGGTTPTPSLSTPVLTLVVISPTQINVSWTNSTPTNGAGAVNNYTVVLSLTNDFASVLGVFNGMGNSAQATGLTPNTKYYFRVRASDGSIYSGYGIANATTQQGSGGGEQGIPVDDEWTELSSTTRSENNLTAVNGSSRSRTNLKITGGNVGFFQSVPNGGAMILSTNANSLDGFNESAWLFNHNPVNKKVQAYGAGGLLNQETSGGIPDNSVITVDLTATQIIFSYTPPGGSKTQWAAANIQVGTVFYLKSFIDVEGGTQSNITQGGFA